jgi:hypothetical protein
MIRNVYRGLKQYDRLRMFPDLYTSVHTAISSTFVWKVTISCVIKLKPYLATAHYINGSKKFYIDDIGWYMKRQIPGYAVRIYCDCLVYCEYLCIIYRCWRYGYSRAVRGILTVSLVPVAPGGSTVRCIIPAITDGKIALFIGKTHLDWSH